MNDVFASLSDMKDIDLIINRKRMKTLSNHEVGCIRLYEIAASNKM